MVTGSTVMFAQADTSNFLSNPMVIVGGIVFVVLFIPFLVSRFLTTVEAGAIRLVSWFGGVTKTYKGPGKAWEVPVLTTATTIPSKAINIDLDIADQTADVDEQSRPKPIKVRVLASAIVSVGDANEMIKTAANKFFSKTEMEQNSILVDLLTSTGRRAINLLHHDELFNLKPQNPNQNIAALPVPIGDNALAATEDDDRLAIIIKSACSRELQDLGLVFNSLNIKEVQSEVAEARRRQSAVEAKANADIVTADQERRAREAQLSAEQAISDKTRDLDRRKAENAAQVAEAEAEKQTSLAKLREAELRATQIAKAMADADQVKVAAEAQAEAEAIKLRRIAEAQAEAIEKVNQAMMQGGDAFLKLKQLEMVPTIAPVIAQALAEAKLVNISSGGEGGAAGDATNQITGVIQTVLAAQLVNTTLNVGEGAPAPKKAKALPAQGSSEPVPSASEAAQAADAAGFDYEAAAPAKQESTKLKFSTPKAPPKQQ